MDGGFARALDDWTAFYTLMGGVAATLLGLLFVAVSLRLNIFHQRNVADVRAFAAYTLGTFLMGIAVPGFVLAPHEQRGSLATALLLAAAAGLVAVARVFRLWTALNPLTTNVTSGARFAWQGVLYRLIMAAPYAGLAAVALLLWLGHPAALGWLAVAEGSLLALGTAAAWLILSNAGNAETAPDAS